MKWNNSFLLLLSIVLRFGCHRRSREWLNSWWCRIYWLLDDFVWIDGRFFFHFWWHSRIFMKMPNLSKEMIDVMMFPITINIKNDNENDNDKQWFFVRSDDVYWSFMPECGLWWVPRRECAQCKHRVHNTWCNFVRYQWLSLIIIENLWLSLVVSNYHWLSLIIIDYHWLSLTRRECAQCKYRVHNTWCNCVRYH